MSERAIRILAAAVALLGLMVAILSFGFLIGIHVITQPTLLTNLIGGISTVIAAIAGYTAWRPRKLFRPEEDEMEAVHEAPLTPSGSQRHKRRPHKANVGQRAAHRDQLHGQTQAPGQEQLVGSAELTHDLRSLQRALEVAADAFRAIKHDLPQRMKELEQAVRTNTAAITKMTERIGDGAAVSTTHTSNNDNFRIASQSGSPMSGSGVSTERDDHAVQAMLQQLAQKCMGRGLTVKRVRDELPNEWNVDSLDSSDMPDAFLIHVSDQETWVVPNTREWLPFRGKGWFDVVNGIDVISARISVVRRLPVLGRTKNVIVRGAVEVTVQ